MPLTNPLAGQTSHAAAFTIELSPEIFDYFFAKDKPSVFCGTRGARQTLAAAMFQKLFIECLRRGVLPMWMPEQEATVQQILDEMNFQPQPKPKPKRAKPKNQTP